jgi:centrosomal protein CEP135
LIKSNTQSKEISQLRTKLVEYETENERVKRQLTNERFERERAAQELRKLSDSVEVNSSRLVRSISPSKTSYSSSLL